MNLSSTDVAGLIEVLHTALLERPEVTSGHTCVVVEWQGRVFAVRREEVGVMGPFDSVFDLVFELGEPVGDRTDTPYAPTWYWDGRNFLLDHEQRTAERKEGSTLAPRASKRTIDRLRGKTFMFGVTRPRGE